MIDVSTDKKKILNKLDTKLKAASTKFMAQIQIITFFCLKALTIPQFAKYVICLTITEEYGEQIKMQYTCHCL